MNLNNQIHNKDLTTIDNRLLNLIKKELNTEEQQQFVNNFVIYLDYGYDDTAFIINFDDVWQWVGFTQKVNAKRLLINKFIENIDYVYQKGLFQKEEHFNKSNIYSTANNKELILLTVNTFKKFCMVASTKRANDICNYYIKMEKIMFQYTKEILIETQNKLNNFIEYDEELFWNENQINDYNNKNVIYFAFIGIWYNERIYKFGKSEQIYTREFKQHQKFFDTFKMRFVIELKENNITELFTIKEKQNIDYINFFCLCFLYLKK